MGLSIVVGAGGVEAGPEGAVVGDGEARGFVVIVVEELVEGKNAPFAGELAAVLGLQPDVVVEAVVDGCRLRTV